MTNQSLDQVWHVTDTVPSTIFIQTNKSHMKIGLVNSIDGYTCVSIKFLSEILKHGASCGVVTNGDAVLLVEGKVGRPCSVLW